MGYALRTHLTLLFMLVALLPILLFGAIQIERIGTAENEQKERQHQMTERLAAEISTYVENHKNVIEAFAGEISLSRQRNPVVLSAALKAVVLHFPGFVNIYAADAAGRNLAFYTPETAKETPQYGFDFSSRNYYAALQTQCQTVISPLFQGQVTTDKPLIIIATPIYNAAGDFDGYLSAALNLSEVAVLADKYDYGASSYVTILDSKNKVIFSSGTSQEPLADFSGNTVISEMRTLQSGAQTRYFEMEKQEEYASFTTLPELDWLIFSGRSTASYQAEFFAFLRRTLTLLLLTATGCIALSWMIAGFLNAPFHLFMAYMRAVGRQDFSAAFPRRQLRRMPRELFVLARRFFLMAARLRNRQAELRRLNEALEQKVEERTDNLQAVLESMTDAVVMLDTDGRVVFANRRMAALLSLSPPEFNGMHENTLAKLFAGIAVDAAPIWETLKKDGSIHMLQLAQNERYFTIQGFAVQSERSGARLGYGFLFSDITERYAIDQLKNNLISLAAHEFKTPLTGIRGGVETLLRPGVVWDETFRAELLHDIHEDALRIQRLIDDWLDISKLSAGTLVLRRTPVSLDKLLLKIEKYLRRQGYHFTLTAKIAPKCARIYADPGRLEQVLTNLMENAIFYSDDDDACIHFTASPKKDSIRIRIADAGIGIAASDLPHIFERFYRADISTTQRRRGTGLGLAVCKGIIEMHSGTITAKSALGRGSAFTIVLPRLAKEDEQQ